MTLSFRTKPEFERGRKAEQLVVNILQGRGWYVIPSYDYAGENGDRAPRIQGLEDGIVLPDLDIAKRGHRKWAEVKLKAHADYTIKTGTYDHGIGLRKWSQYRRIQRETGCHVYLFIVEADREMVLIDSLDRLGCGRVYQGDKMDYGGMMFWPREAFITRIQFGELAGLFDRGIPLAFEID